jgi:hypothetical protein
MPFIRRSVHALNAKVRIPIDTKVTGACISNVDDVHGARQFHRTNERIKDFGAGVAVIAIVVSPTTSS